MTPGRLGELPMSTHCHSHVGGRGPSASGLWDTSGPVTSAVPAFMKRESPSPDGEAAKSRVSQPAHHCPLAGNAELAASLRMQRTAHKGALHSEKIFPGPSATAVTAVM